MDKKLAVLTAVFAISAGLVFAQEMKADAPVDAMAQAEEAATNEEMNSELLNAEDMNAENAELNEEVPAAEEAAPAAGETK
jgi:hypothetical protein